MGFRVYVGVILGNGKESGNYYSILVLNRDNGKGHENYNSILGLCRALGGLEFFGPSGFRGLGLRFSGI